MKSLRTDDIEGARPAIKHHSKQLYTLLKSKMDNQDLGQMSNINYTQNSKFFDYRNEETGKLFQ